MIKIKSNGDRTRFSTDGINPNFIKKIALENDINYSSYNEAIKKSDIKIGFEFEFYLNKDINMEKLISSILSFGKPLVYCPKEYNTQDKELDVWTMERDGTLINPLKNGFEIVSPKLDLYEAPFIMKRMLHIIREYGNTDKTCGLHFHISSESQNIKDINPSKLMLFLDERKTLEHWKDRTGTNKEIMDIFKETRISDFNKDFKNLSRFYTIVSRSTYGISNHLEVRAMGGANYEFKEKEIMKDFKEFIETYYIACNPLVENEKHIELTDKFLANSKLKRSIDFNDVLKEAKSIVDFDSLNIFDKKDFLETAIFNLEDKLEFVPIKKLLKDVDRYIQEEEENALPNQLDL